MRSSFPLAVALAAALAAAAIVACSDALAPVAVPPPDSLRVQARSLTSALLEWVPVDNANVIAYRIERRREFDEPFETIADNITQALPGPLFLLDDGLEPETFYGYRVRVLDRFGGESGPSVVRGMRTPPLPGIVVRTVSRLATPAAADADGYTIVISRGTDSLVGPLSPSGERRFSPLTPGSYHVDLHGLAANCVVDEGGPARQAAVTDAGVATLTRVDYVLSCTDPQRGRITARVNVAGEDRDSNGVVLHLDGLSPQAPESLRVTSDTARLGGPDGGLKAWIGLRPGDYQVALAGLDPKCSADGTQRAVQVRPLSDDTVRFAVTCPTPVVDTTTTLPGYQLRNAWGAIAAGRVTLTISLDMGAYNDPSVNGAGPDDIYALQGSTRYDSTALRFVSAANVAGSGLQNLAAGGSRKGDVQWANFSTLSALQTGQHGIAVITFEVLGTTGTTATHTEVSVAQSKSEADLLPHVAVREAVLSLSGGAGGNRPPSAEANGPYAGTVGTPVGFTANGSADPDGSVASYAWSFGDGGNAATATPTHSYAAAGSYTVRVTVTDNGGATATDSATATITAGGGGGNQPPVAQAGGPYFGTTGAPVLFSGAGSSDPDGSIAAHAWFFGDGATGTGVAPQHVYSAAGTFVATLTVTDNQGATAQATASVNVATAGGSTPFVWSSSWSGTPQKDSLVTLTVQLDLSTDIPETPGAEELQSFVVDSLKWNPAVLQYFAYNHGPGGYGSVQTSIPDGRLIIQGSLGAANRGGVITIATIRFKVLANPGASTTTSTALGALTGTAATGSFSYRSRVRIQEATLTTQ